jgi:hypothetical protein
MNKIKNFERFSLFESGVRGIKDLAKRYNEADLYFHIDLDGVTSAIGIKEYLAQYGIKVVGFHTVQYGDKEWTVEKPKPDRLAVLVDFTHGKTIMQIHTDHHDNQVGVADTTATSFKRTKSNASTISQEISPKEIFPPEDMKLISTVDSADFANNDITVDDVIRAAYNFDKKIGIEKNRTYMGLVVNKMLLAYKNKPNFLEEVVKQSNPSLISIFTNIRKIAVKNNYGIEDLVSKTENYKNSQVKDKKMVQFESVEDIKSLSNGQYGMVGNVLVQYGGGNVFKGGYDRYIPFKNVPEAEYLIMGWSLGLVQVAKNPFKKGNNKFNLGDIAKKIFEKYKSRFSKIELSFGDIKSSFEMKIKSNDSFGFAIDDFFALYGDKIKKTNWGKDNDDIIRDIGKKRYRFLSDKQKKILDNFTVSLYDFIMSQSGGHKDITNISGLNFVKPDPEKFIKQLMIDFAEELKDAKLK